jgi:tetratricopeptide (TPR) repeat protein
MEDDSIKRGLEEARKESALYPQESLVKTRALLTRARIQKNRDLEILALSNMALHYSDMNEWQKGLTYCNLTLRLALQEEDHDVLSSVYMTQAILQFRTLKLRACILSLQTTWEIQQRRPQTHPFEKATLLQYTATYSFICGNPADAIQTCDRAIEPFLSASRDSFGCLAHSTPALFRVWYAFEVQSEEAKQYVREAEELLKRASKYPIDGSYDNGFFHYSCLAELARLKGDYQSAENHYETVLNGATNQTQTANYHSVAARSALCRMQLGDTEGSIERIHQLLDHIDIPATRALLPQSLRMAMDIAESLDQMELYSKLANQFKTANDRLKKAKMEAKHQLRVLEILTKDIYVS